MFKLRLISVVDVVITPMNPYQPIPFHILFFLPCSSPEFYFMLAQTSDEITEEEKVFERKDRFSFNNKKTPIYTEPHF